MPQMNPMNWIVILMMSLMTYWLMFSMIFFSKTSKKNVLGKKPLSKMTLLFKW